MHEHQLQCLYRCKSAVCVTAESQQIRAFVLVACCDSAPMDLYVELYAYLLWVWRFLFFFALVLQWYREIGGSVQWRRSTRHPRGALQWTRPQVTVTNAQCYINKRAKSKNKIIVFCWWNSTTEHKACSWRPALNKPAMYLVYVCLNC